MKKITTCQLTEVSGSVCGEPATGETFQLVPLCERHLAEAMNPAPITDVDGAMLGVTAPPSCRSCTMTHRSVQTGDRWVLDSAHEENCLWNAAWEAITDEISRERATRYVLDENGEPRRVA